MLAFLPASSDPFMEIWAFIDLCQLSDRESQTVPDERLLTSCSQFHKNVSQDFTKRLTCASVVRTTTVFKIISIIYEGVHSDFSYELVNVFSTPWALTRTNQKAKSSYVFKDFEETFGELAVLINIWWWWPKEQKNYGQCHVETAGNYLFLRGFPFIQMGVCISPIHFHLTGPFSTLFLFLG